MDFLFFAQQTMQVPPIDYTAAISALSGGGAGSLAIWLAMKWVQTVNAERDKEKQAWLDQSKAQKDEYAGLLKLVLEAISGTKT